MTVKWRMEAICVQKGNTAEFHSLILYFLALKTIQAFLLFSIVS